MKSLDRIGGQDYCRHHINKAAVAAGIITEIKPGAGSVGVTNTSVRQMTWPVGL